jgi:hypothetical protein
MGDIDIGTKPWRVDRDCTVTVTKGVVYLRKKDGTDSKECYTKDTTIDLKEDDQLISPVPSTVTRLET